MFRLFPLNFPQMSKLFFQTTYEQMPQAWVWAHHISILVRLLPDHRIFLGGFLILDINSQLSRFDTARGSGTGPAKINACKYVLFTKIVSEVKIRDSVYICMVEFQVLHFNIWAKIHFESILRHRKFLQKALKYKKVSFFIFLGNNIPVSVVIALKRKMYFSFTPLFLPSYVL